MEIWSHKGKHKEVAHPQDFITFPIVKMVLERRNSTKNQQTWEYFPVGEMNNSYGIGDKWMKIFHGKVLSTQI